MERLLLQPLLPISTRVEERQLFRTRVSGTHSLSPALVPSLDLCVCQSLESPVIVKRTLTHRHTRVRERV